MVETATVTKRTLATPMIQTMQGLMPHVPALLPQDIPAEQFRAALYLELSGRNSLGECDQDSLRDCVIKAATYGLLPGRDCHFLPFSNRRGNSGKKTATFVPNYFGLILALERTGKIRRAFAHPVHQGDEFQFDMFLDRPVHQPAITLGRTPGKELFYYGAVMFKDGTCAFEVLSLDELEAVKKRAPAHDSGPWVTDRVMMCRKTCIKRVAKYVKLTPEQRQMLEEDEVRETQDIPDARHRQNIVDLFGDHAGGDVINHRTGEVVSVGGQGGTGTQPLWRETLRAHYEALREASEDPDAGTGLQELVTDMEKALADLTYPDTEGFKLADAALQWVDTLGQ